MNCIENGGKVERGAFLPVKVHPFTLKLACASAVPPVLEVIKLLLCSTQPIMKLQMLISLKISRKFAFFRLR